MEKDNSKEVVEGSAKLLLSDKVFYNNKMKNLRDISVLFVKYFGNKNSMLLDSTCATGVRGIRYIKEAGIKNVTFLDINLDATENAQLNLKNNSISIEIQNKSIQEFCSVYSDKRFEFIDLDPFGTPQPYLNDIMKVIKEGGFLMITATDTAVLCGAHSDACLKIYGAKPMHNELCKEAGLRILLAHIAKVAATYNFGIEPILSISDMHYMRVFLKVNAGAKKAITSLKECGFASFCGNCRAFYYKKGFAPYLEKTCTLCNGRVDSFGQFYLGSINDRNSINKLIRYNAENKIIENAPYLEKMLRLISNEPDIVFFYSIPKLTKSIKSVSVSPENIIKELKENGFEASRTQFDRDGIKTTATINEIKKILEK